MIVILVGIPGSGKSTVLKALSELHPSIQIVNYGEMMLKEAASHGVDRDSLRKMPIDKQQDIGLKASLKIAQASHGITIVDTHACIRTPVGYCPGIPQKILQALNPKALVLIHCAPSLILERRLGDSSRNRDNEDLQQLTIHQDLTRSYLVAASVLTGSVLCLVNNDGQKMSENIEPLSKLIGSLGS